MQRLAMLGTVCALLIGGSVLVAFAPSAEERSTQRQLAWQRWNAQPLKNYRITVVANVLGTRCSQELEVRNEVVVKTIEDSCRPTQVGLLTVERLFSWGDRTDTSTQCSPSFLNCVCRLVRDGTIDYHPVLGYPKRIDMRRNIQPNLLSLGYWQRVLASHSFSTCSSTTRRFQIAVVSLTSLP